MASANASGPTNSTIATNRDLSRYPRRSRAFCAKRNKNIICVKPWPNCLRVAESSSRCCSSKTRRANTAISQNPRYCLGSVGFTRQRCLEKLRRRLTEYGILVPRAETKTPRDSEFCRLQTRKRSRQISKFPTRRLAGVLRRHPRLPDTEFCQTVTRSSCRARPRGNPSSPCLAETAVFLARRASQPGDPRPESARQGERAVSRRQKPPSSRFYKKSLKYSRTKRREAGCAYSDELGSGPDSARRIRPRFPAAGRAREIFTSLGETRRLARLDNNVGNIYHRQDRFEEALACYERCYDQLLPYGDSQELVTALSNMAVCLISLNDFPRALATYERARDYCDATTTCRCCARRPTTTSPTSTICAASTAAESRCSRRRAASAKPPATTITWLCHLDLSEIYLELNLSSDARDMAHEGSLRFQKLGMGYEEAKCTAYEAMALASSAKPSGSGSVFAIAGDIRARKQSRLALADRSLPVRCPVQ